MPDQQIDNAGGAFQPLDTLATQGAEPGNAPGPRYVNALNTGAVAILESDWVALDTAGGLSHIYGVVRGVRTTTLALGVGFAQDAIAVGAIGRVIVDGPAVGRAGAAGLVTGAQVVGSTVATDDGEVVAASGATLGQVLGVNLGGAIAAHTKFPVWVKGA